MRADPRYAPVRVLRRLVWVRKFADVTLGNYLIFRIVALGRKVPSERENSHQSAAEAPALKEALRLVYGENSAC